MTANVTSGDLAALHIHEALTATLEAFRASAARLPVADQVGQVDEAMAELLAARGALTGRALGAQPMCRLAQPASVHTDLVGGPAQGCDLALTEAAPGLPAALDVCGRLLAGHEAATGRRIGVRVSVWRYTDGKPLEHAEIDVVGALADDTDQIKMADVRALCAWLGVTPTVRTNGRDDIGLTVVEATVTRDGVKIEIGALSRKLTVTETRAALGLPAGNGGTDRAGAEGLAGPVEAGPDGDVCVLCVEPIPPAGEVLDCGYGPEHPGCHQDAPDAHPDELSGAER